MSNTGWTEKQLQAIETRGKNVLVSAAAGSGKTAVLTERILRLVTEERVSLKELLVVTFTEAAASEMKERIAAALTKAANAGDFSEIAETQLRQLGTAKIMTLHAFCLTILRKYYYRIGLDPSFQTADEKRAAALKEEALDEVMAAAFSDECADFQHSFKAFLSAYADIRDEGRVREKILTTHEFIRTLPNPFDWLKQHVACLFEAETTVSQMPAMRFAMIEIAGRLALARTLTEHVGSLLISLGLSGLAAKNAVDLEMVSGIERLFLAGDMAGTRRALGEAVFETFRAGKAEKEAYEGVKALVKARRDRVKDILQKELRASFFAQSEQEYAAEIAYVAPYAHTLELLVDRFDDVYRRLKQNENVIDFSDFEHMALQILEDEQIAAVYKRRLLHIFVDEYQDSNYVQEALVCRVAQGNNIFMVGDVKQSIYRFRNAAPAIFLEKQRTYEVMDTPETQNIRIDLSKNFRSKCAVLDAVNALFEVLMERRYSGMDYDEEARLQPGISYEPEMEGHVQLHLIEKDKEQAVFSSSAAGEAALCAELIEKIVGRPYFDAKLGTVRPIGYRDIAILMRSAKSDADVFYRTLTARGVPAFTDRGGGYFETIEIDTFLDLLRAIVNRRRDVPLTAALCSVVFGFALSELAKIRAEKTDGYFHTAFLAYASCGADEALREKCVWASSLLTEWRDAERFMRLDDFLWRLLRESGFYDYVGALPQGAIRQGNLRALVELAADFQRGRVAGLRGFLAYLGKIELRGGEPQAKLPAEGAEVCRIMTIHGSKGLEFPVVILCGLGKAFANGGSSDASLLLEREDGLSLHWSDPETHAYKKTLLHAAIRLRRDIEERAEELRLLYVAMTRAMDTLHMLGTVSDPEKELSLFGVDEAEPSVDTDILRATNFLQLILPTALKRRECFQVETVRAVSLGDAIAPSAGTQAGSSQGVVAADVADGVDDHGHGNEQEEESLSAFAPFVYPYANSTALKSKYSVTELGRIHAPRPLFFMAGGSGEADEDAGLSASEKGTALHKAFELLDFAEAYAHRCERTWFDAFFAELALRGALSELEILALDAEILHRFANSDFCRRAATAAFLTKELAFNMKLSYREAIQIAGGDVAGAADEEIIVQGVVDCLFEEAETFVLVDYKSGYFDLKAIEPEQTRIRETYGGQLRLYRYAVESIFEKPVRESLVYMTRTGITVEIPEL